MLVADANYLYPECATTIGVSQLSTLLFNIFVEAAIWIARSSRENNGTDNCSRRNLSVLEFTDDVGLLSEDADRFVRRYAHAFYVVSFLDV